MTQSLNRVQIIQGTPPALPGKCVICGTTEGPFVDIGLDLEFYGVVYFCVNNCLIELAQAFDYHGPKQWRMMQNEVSYQRQQINELKDRNGVLENALAAMGAVLNSPDLPVDTNHSVDEQSKDSTGEPEQLQLELDFSATEGKERDSESDDERGSSDIRGIDSDDDLRDFFAKLDV